MTNRKYISSGNSWTPEEIEYVRQLKEQGYPLGKIKNEFNIKFNDCRTDNAIYHTIRKLNYPTTKVLWTQEELDYLLSTYDYKMSMESLTDLINRKFNNDRTVKTVIARLEKVGVKRTHWTQQEDDYLLELIERGTHTTSQIAQKVNKKFNRTRSENALRDRLSYLGVKLLEPFHNHNLITRSKFCQENDIKKPLFDKLVKEYNLTIHKKDRFIFIHIDNYDLFIKAVKDYKNKVQKETDTLKNLYYTIQEASKKLNLKTDLISSWVKHKIILSKRINGNVFIEKQEIQKLVIFFLEYEDVRVIAKRLFYSDENVKRWTSKHNIRHKIFRNVTYIHKKDLQHFLDNRDKMEWTPVHIKQLRKLHKEYTNTKDIVNNFLKNNDNFNIKETKNKLKELKLVGFGWTAIEIKTLKKLTLEYSTLKEVHLNFNDKMKKKQSGYRTRNLDAITRKTYELKITPSTREKNIFEEQTLIELAPSCVSYLELIKKYNETAKIKKSTKVIQEHISKLGIIIDNDMWSTFDENLLLDLATQYPDKKELHLRFNEQAEKKRTFNSIYKKILKHGFKKFHFQNWSEHEVEVLIKLLKKETSYLELTKKFNRKLKMKRSKNSIIQKVKKLNLHLKTKN